MYMWVHACVGGMFAVKRGFFKSLEENIRCPEADVTGSCELIHLDAGN